MRKTPRFIYGYGEGIDDQINIQENKENIAENLDIIEKEGSLPFVRTKREKQCIVVAKLIANNKFAGDKSIFASLQIVLPHEFQRDHFLVSVFQWIVLQ